MKKLCLVFLLFLFFLIPFNVKAEEQVRLYLFYSSSCPHCASEEKFLNEIEDKYSYLTIYKYEISEEETRVLLAKVFDTMDFTSNSVPITVIGSEYFIGYSTSVGYQLEDTIKYYSGFSHKDPVGEILGLVDKFVGEENPKGDVNTSKTIPFLGEVDPKIVSLPLVAIVLGLVDGFNPCAMWILLFLISVLIGLNDRKKMWILGLVFLASSALVYALFMLAWLNVALLTIQVRWLQIIIATIAIIAALINLKSYYKEKDGCQVVDSKRRTQIFEKIKQFTTKKSLIISILGIIALAFTVNLIELACSAGLPLLFTQILALNELSKFEYFLNIGIYILFFLLDDLIVFIIAMITLKVTGISTKYSKYSHLIGGIIMLIIAALMLFKPEWLMFNFS